VAQRLCIRCEDVGWWRRIALVSQDVENDIGGMDAVGERLPGAEVLRQQRRRCFLSLHFLFKDLTQYQE
jgi:hypothetical protein